MSRKSRYRRRRLAKQEQTLGPFVLFLGVVFYFFGQYVAWQWGIVLLVLFISLAIVVTWWSICSARRRQQKRLLLTDALDLSPNDFELRIQHLLQDLGWERVEQIGGSGDGGVDIRGIYQGQRCIVQCKRYRGRVEPKYIRDLEGARSHEQADRAFLITTGYFTEQGYQWAVGKPIELWDGATLTTRFQEQQKILEDPVRKRTERQRIQWFSGSTASINAILILWAGVTAEPVSVSFNSAVQNTVANQPVIATSIPSTTPTTQATPLPLTTCGEGVIMGVERLVLRDEPGLQTERLNDYSAGTRVTMLCDPTITRDSIVWQRVRVEGEEGWMSKRFLE
ncbi:MAG: hypothetical protein GFH27_549331n3 [Chloroflexi bacterium AL-W]|nr:hypothetical protein [Chloroflexi bacterium AL-N1]NOK70304.1 hypothetical protein [Chloroflexi bacterium AL-N10]NOK77982.1 hypothetical protein [Chloroflexi bacterium AL-N5]NOK85081.1 hypothetical protein [Chloroflexi bacterium AL-W]